MIDLILAILGVWFVALFAGPAIYAAMGLAGFAFLFLAGIPGIVIPQKVAMAVNSFPLLAAPLFILMGNLMNSAGITHRIFDFAKAVVGWMRGGLCQANIIGSVIFAGMSGSAVADAAGLGTVEIEAMKKEGYDAETAAAITAASATIGPIIPPSLPMIVYGVAAETSIGGLFLAGVVPGLLMAVALMLMVRHLAIRRNLPRHPFEGAAALWVAFRRAFWALMAPVVLFGGLFSGIFTPTEAAAVAVDLRARARTVRLPRFPARRPAAAHPRHRGDHGRGDGAGDDRIAAGLLHLGVAPAAGVRRHADRR